MSGNETLQAAWQGSAKELTASMEKYLTAGMFGDADNISRTAAAYYHGAAWACETACGITPGSLNEESVPYLESLRRFAVDEALHHLMAEEPEKAREVLRSHLTLRARAVSDPLFTLDVQPGGSVGYPTFLHKGKDHWISRLFLKRFSDTVIINGDSVDMSSCPVTAFIEGAHSRAVALTRRSVPRLAKELFESVHHVVVYRATQPYSGYTVSAPLFIFVAEQTFDRDDITAELLVHESLHQKLSDISLSRSLLRADYNDTTSATIAVPWSFGSNRIRRFSADRSFAAFHVYTHQAVLYLGMLATSTSDEEAASAVENLILSWARAAHFDREFNSGPVRDEWGTDGYRFAEWLSSAVCNLGNFRLPDGTALSSHAEAFAGPKTAASK